MNERKVVGFDLLREDLPPRPGFDPESDIPLAESMANEDLLVTAKKHPGRFHEVLSLACQMMEKANPGMRAAIYVEKYAANGEVAECLVTPIPKAERE